jgi:hypothetical protein
MSVGCPLRSSSRVICDKADSTQEDRFVSTA